MYSVTQMPGRTLVLHAIVVMIAAAALCGARPHAPQTYGTLTGDRWVHLTSRGESWATIGARVGVDPAVLAARNGRTVGAALSAGEAIGIDNRHVAPAYQQDELLINVPQRMLFHYWGGVTRAHYPIAVGQASWHTPLGPFTVVTMEVDPTWDVPVSIQEEMRRAGRPVLTNVPPGPTNPLGRFWIGSSNGSIGIHGTPAPASIYRFATHGCIRLHPDDVESLFPFVSIGDRGRIVYEPVLVGFDGTDVFLEVHRDVYARVPASLSRAWEVLDLAGLRGLVDPIEVARAVRAAEGLAVPVTSRP